MKKLEEYVVSIKKEKFIKTLETLFEVDKSDLDFGIYKMMNKKRDIINNFIHEKLPIDIENELKEIYTNESKISEKEEQIYAHLYNFFSRYYDEGDFISQRRYKDEIYAIPYSGEEVKLYWANSDQYYIKSSENFKDYTFKTQKNKRVNFKLTEAISDINNNKAIDENKLFILSGVDENIYIANNELFILFEYRGFPKKIKQNKLNEDTVKKINEFMYTKIKDENYREYYLELNDLSPNEKNKKRTVLEKELNNYTSKNSFDYFIHKDLESFLKRELDFYIKNEMLFIDEINVDSKSKLFDCINEIKVLKKIANKIIQFLSQIENFQKKLWLKKKFVIESNYCITLDKIPCKFYEEILENKEQINEWNRLFKINKEEINIEYLLQNKYLILDTKYFNNKFKENIISEFDDIDNQTNGLIIHSENFQALNLIEKVCENNIDGIYIDPPYNTDGSEILYKNGYKDSSWLSLMYDRLKVSKKFLKNNGILCILIDDYEVGNLLKLMEQLLPEYQIRIVVVESNHRGRSKSNFSTTHEFALWAIPKDKDLITREKEISDNISRNLRRTGTDSTRESSVGMFYGIEVDLSTLDIIGTTEPLELDEEIPIHKNQNTAMVWPIDDEGIERRWYYGRERVEKESKEDTVWAKYIKGKLQIHYYQDGKPKRRKTVWTGKELDASTYGSELLNSMFGLGNVKFSFPKSINAVRESLQSITYDENSVYLDFFAGSGTTAHAVIDLNMQDNGNRKYILVEMGEYFDITTKSRIEKAIYANKWDNGTPINKNKISHVFKYITLEQYEDSLNNINFENNKIEKLDERLQEEYTLQYMLDMESSESNAFINHNKFKNPFEYKLNIERNGESRYRNVNLVETFNYLLGLHVEKIYAKEYYNFDGNNIEEYYGGKYIFKRVKGTFKDDKKVLIIWRNISDDIKVDNDVLNYYINKKNIILDEYEYIYINGDNTISINHNSNQKIKLIDEEFKHLMFDIDNI